MLLGKGARVAFVTLTACTATPKEPPPPAEPTSSEPDLLHADDCSRWILEKGIGLGASENKPDRWLGLRSAEAMVMARTLCESSFDVTLYRWWSRDCRPDKFEKGKKRYSNAECWWEQTTPARAFLSCRFAEAERKEVQQDTPETNRVFSIEFELEGRSIITQIFEGKRRPPQYHLSMHECVQGLQEHLKQDLDGHLKTGQQTKRAGQYRHRRYRCIDRTGLKLPRKTCKLKTKPLDLRLEKKREVGERDA